MREFYSQSADNFGMKYFFLLLVSCLWVFEGCATKEEEPSLQPVAMETPSPDVTLPKLPRILFPIQSVYACNTAGGSFDESFIVLHYGRRDSYSVLPERLVLTPGSPNTISPVTLLGKKDLKTVDTDRGKSIDDLTPQAA